MALDTSNHLSLALICLQITSILGCARAVRERAFLPVFAVSHSNLHPGMKYKRSEIKQRIAIYSSNHLSLDLICLQLTSRARAHPKIEVICRDIRARERWFEVCIAILYLISDLLYCIPGCKWEWLTVQKPAKMRARAVGLRGRTLKSRLSVEILELERDGLRYVQLYST